MRKYEINDEKLDNMLSNYCKKSVPYTFRVKEKTKKEYTKKGFRIKYSTAAGVLLFAFFIGLCVNSIPNFFSSYNDFFIMANAEGVPEKNSVLQTAQPIKIESLSCYDYSINDSSIEVDINFGVCCVGKHISEISYTSNYSYFSIDYLSVEDFKISSRQKMTLNKQGIVCNSFSVDYDDEVILIANDAGDGYPVNLVCLFDANYNAEAERLLKQYKTGENRFDTLHSIYDMIFRNVYVDMKIIFDDGSVSTKRIELNFDEKDSSYKTFKPVVTATLV
ncbi:MAG: hypothetical protein J1E41_05340 [Ruminococcus sp.]|nr:hypothetical protein [Ruminococcus sp.]